MTLDSDNLSNYEELKLKLIDLEISLRLNWPTFINKAFLTQNNISNFEEMDQQNHQYRQNYQLVAYKQRSKYTLQQCKMPYTN